MYFVNHEQYTLHVIYLLYEINMIFFTGFAACKLFCFVLLFVLSNVYHSVFIALTFCCSMVFDYLAMSLTSWFRKILSLGAKL